MQCKGLEKSRKMWGLFQKECNETGKKGNDTKSYTDKIFGTIDL